jgi:hypothetical protein
MKYLYKRNLEPLHLLMRELVARLVLLLVITVYSSFKYAGFYITWNLVVDKSDLFV